MRANSWDWFAPRDRDQAKEQMAIETCALARMLARDRVKREAKEGEVAQEGYDGEGLSGTGPSLLT